MGPVASIANGCTIGRAPENDHDRICLFIGSVNLDPMTSAISDTAKMKKIKIA
jgi:hypothetical protein